MKARLVQKDCNTVSLRPFLERAARDGVELLCFGELAASGCLYQTRETPPLEEVLEQLRPYDFRVMLGLPYDSPQGKRNAYVYAHRGEYQVYHKVNLFPAMNEDRVYRPGETPGIFETDFGRVGTAICYDIRFPELFRKIKNAGAEILFVPAAFPLVRIETWRSLLIERAVETGLKTVGINAVGDDGTNVFGGNSMVIEADGTVTHETDRSSELTLDFVL
jgi:predicted amidohydrolase